ncbi:MAG: AbgT family transporter [Rhodobacteraceae bacterium]|nr:AbgT family transporter [Paracoccaceae bacterium]
MARYGSVGFTYAPQFGTQVIVSLLFFFFLIPGIVYGRAVGLFQTGVDVVRQMEKAAVAMASFIVMVFCMAQSIACYNNSNMGGLIAVQGAALLELLPA